MVGLAGCRSPLGGQSALKADLSLSFIVSGAERLAHDAALPRARGDRTGAASRLLLPTAVSLEVTLTPEAGGDTISAKPVQIVAGAATVPVSLSAVPYGRYTVKAEAKDASGVIRFNQTAQLTVGDSELVATLNLVPTDSAGAALVATTLHDIDIAELPPGEARTWLVAPGSRLLVARSIFLSGLGSEARVYLQAWDGTLVSDPLGTVSRLSTVDLPAGEPAYLTVYNGGSGAQPASRAFPGPAMVDVPAGTFQRDATSADNVSYVSAFSMADLEVTRELYLAVMGTDPSDNAYSSGVSDPVHFVNWYHAIAFCNKLSLMEGLTPAYAVTVGGSPLDWATLAFTAIPTATDLDWNNAVADHTVSGYRLPTEMEWMWAAMGATRDSRTGDIVDGINRNGHTKGYGGSIEANDGTAQIGSFAWYNLNSDAKTHTAGSRQPNELALHDLSGNVQEWLWDWYAASYPPGSISDHQGPASSDQRVHRGGGYSNAAASCSINDRVMTYPYQRFGQLGFRVARGVLPTYTITYHANGATRGSVPATSPVLSGSTQVVLGNTGSLVGPAIQDGIGQRFLGWNTKADGTGLTHYSGSTIIVGPSTNLYAQYTVDSSVLIKVGPAGGLVFYDKGSFDTTDAGPSWRYIEAAPYDQSSGVAWGPSGIYATGQYLHEMGAGYVNTLAMVTAYPSGAYAANICWDLVLNGYSDWYLPSSYELGGNDLNTGGMWEKLFFNRGPNTFPNYAIFTHDTHYWSSSEPSAATSIHQRFGLDNSSSGSTKNSLYRVRAVRRF